MTVPSNVPLTAWEKTKPAHSSASKSRTHTVRNRGIETNLSSQLHKT
jgi:hypothetical protein